MALYACRRHGGIRYNVFMFAARPFLMNTAFATLAGEAARAITVKTTTIKG